MRAAAGLHERGWPQRIRWLLLIIGFATAWPSAATADAQPPAVVLDASAERVSLTGRIGSLVDPGGLLDIEAIRAPPAQARFALPPSPLRADASAAPQWFKVRLRREAAQVGEWVLAVDALPLLELRCFGPFDEAGSATSAALPGGNPDRYTSHSLGQQRHAFSIAPPAAGSYVVYLRAQSSLPQRYALSLHEAGAFLESLRNGWLLDGACYGMLLSIAAYTVLMWRTFRDPVYLYFIVALGIGFGIVVLLNGHLPRLLWFDRAELPARLLIALPAVFAGFGLLFGRRYLNMSRHVPRIGHLVWAMAAATVVAAVGALAGGLQWPSWLLAGLAAGGLVLLPTSLRPSRKYGLRINGWYLIASSACLLSTLVLLATLWGWLPPQVITQRWLQIAGVALFGLFALIYGQRLPRVRTQQNALQLEAARMAHAAETDPLTGIANRAGLSRRAPALLAPGAQCALLLLDLDRFKPVNDVFGHEVGDAVLMRITRRLTRLTGPQDVLARLGGDEFVLLRADGRRRSDLSALAQRMILLAARPIRLQGHTHQVGISIGIARCPAQGVDLSQLMRRADLALYQVKRSGRGRFAFSEDLPPEDSSNMALL